MFKTSKTLQKLFQSTFFLQIQANWVKIQFFLIFKHPLNSLNENIAYGNKSHLMLQYLFNSMLYTAAKMSLSVKKKKPATNYKSFGLPSKFSCKSFRKLFSNVIITKPKCQLENISLEKQIQLKSYQMAEQSFKKLKFLQPPSLLSLSLLDPAKSFLKDLDKLERV